MPSLPTDPTLSIRLDFDPDLSPTDWVLQIGGRPRLPDALQRLPHYLCGVRLDDPATEIAVFLAFDHDEPGFETMVTNRKVLHAPGSLFEPLVVARSRGERGGGLYEPQRFRASRPTPDLVPADDPYDATLAFPYGGTKLGGAPYPIHGVHHRMFAAIHADGWRLALQLDFPAKTHLDGTWIFGDGLFWLFRRERVGAVEWACCWDF